ncbi:hypothetical protein B0H21DRAFT_729680 [Amylocystis lapponica]|nr:hypothetical protein B0H21DRAFT_729680 [Amylocystis lapponica]
MKRGFLRKHYIGLSPTSSHLHTIAAPREARALAQLSAAPDITRVYSTDPRIVCADTRISNSPYFLYLPAVAGQAELVYIDYLENVKRVAKWPIWQQPAPKLPALPMGIEPTPGKGVGMFATRAIVAGELVCAERPTYAIRLGLKCAYDELDTGALQCNALRGLGESARTALLALKNSYSESDIDPIRGTLLTNVLPIDITEKPDKNPDNTFHGCFTTLSRANHSCRPNANYFFSFSTFHGQFWAMRDIAEGEEITISYAELTDSRAARQARLSSRFFFTCACETCTLSPLLQRESDARREGLARLIARIADESPRVPVKTLEEGLRWAEQEGLTVHYAQVLLYGSAIMLRYYGERMTSQWVDRARDAFRIVEGETSYNVKELDEVRETYRMVATGVVDLMALLCIAQRLA